MTEPEPPPDPRLGIPATDLCPECGGKGWRFKRTIRVLGCGGDYEDWDTEPCPCPRCSPHSKHRPRQLMWKTSYEK